MTPGQYADQVTQEYRERGHTVEVAETGHLVADGLLILPALTVTPAQVMELEGARRYLDCGHAVMVSPSPLSPEALKVAEKLGVTSEQLPLKNQIEFADLWTEWIVPLAGQSLAGLQILKVDETGIERVNARGHTGFIPIESFRAVVTRLLANGLLTRAEINALAIGGASSGVARILAQVPFFEYSGEELRFSSSQPVVATPTDPNAPDRPEALRELGFTGFISLQELAQDLRRLPLQRGLYAILRPGLQEPEFLLQGSGGHSKGNPNVPVRMLQENWVKLAHLLYLGKAGGGDTKANLQSRLRQLLEFGSGKPAKHYGGRFLWQLRGSSQLLVAWKSIPDDPAPAEAQLLRQFVQHYGKLPFANLQD